MDERLHDLPVRERRGSRVRCVLFTNGRSDDVARRLNDLVFPYAVVQPDRRAWQPRGSVDPTEARLSETPAFLSLQQREVVTNWWLAVRRRANTPNWDIVSQATIQGREGLILIEAKAHDQELLKEKVGKKLRKTSSDNSRKNHHLIGEAIREGNDDLNRILPGWNLSRDSHYQLANRLARAWKLAHLGVPVVLVYLGFLGAEEMRHQGRPLQNAKVWNDVMHAHARGIVPDAPWEQALDLNGTPFHALIRSVRCDRPEGLRT